jgi:hypothetical protein
LNVSLVASEHPSLPSAPHPVVSMRRLVISRILLSLIGTLMLRPAAAETPTAELTRIPPSAAVRDSTAVTQAGPGRRLVVAHRRSHSLTLIDLDRGDAVEEFSFPGEPVDVVADRSGGRLFVADAAGHRVVEISTRTGGLALVRVIPVARHPVRLAVSSDGGQLAVTSLWSHRLTFIDDLERPEAATIPLPFPPRELLWLPDGDTLLVADAFDGRLAVVSAERREVARVWDFEGHNLRGLSLEDDGRSLVMTQQVLHPAATTIRDDITSGRLVENIVRTIPLDALAADTSTPPPGDVIPLRNAAAGAGDPAASLPLGRDRRLTLLAGTSELLLHDSAGREIVRRDVGACPVRWVRLIDGDGQPGDVVVLNRFGQSLSVFDPDSQQVTRTISLGELPALAPRDRGERLFFDARLSAAGWLSCQSCHPDGHAIDALVDTFADGSHGSPKRVLSLLGTRDNNPWGWNGAFRELHTQVSQSVTSSMQGAPLAPQQVNDLVAYLHTLRPPPPVEESPSPATAARIERGRMVFAQQGCAACHVPPLTFTSDTLYDVGLADEQGLRKFNPPSLRGLSQRRRFFHDGSAASLREVLIDAGHQWEGNATTEEVESLIAYLLSL